MASDKTPQTGKAPAPSSGGSLPDWMRRNRDAVHVPIRKAAATPGEERPLKASGS